MNVYILGLDHEIQQRDGRTDAALKDNFEKLLRELIAEHSITFIGEETYADKKVIAKEVAESLDICWKPIEIPREKRKELGISNQRLSEPIDIDDMTKGFKAMRTPADATREDYMFEHALTKAGEAQDILVLCGFEHCDELCKRFEKAGHPVTMDSLRKRAWYKDPEC